jgi:hypothetical protein
VGRGKQSVPSGCSDPEVIAATMLKPGVVLRRPVGSDAPFSEHPDLPTQLADDEPRHRPKKTAARPKERVLPNTDEAARIIAFEKEQRLRENQRRQEEAVRKKQRERHDHAIAKRKPRLKRLGGSMMRGWQKSRPSAILSKGNCKRRTPVGRSRRTSWRGLLAGQASSARSGDLRFVGNGLPG